MSEKIQKVLARAGFGSRREIERWIADGRIKVNQSVATLGDRIDGTEQLSLDGKNIRVKPVEKTIPRVIAYHKGIGTICTRDDPEERNTVFEDFPKVKGGRWILVGRLDINTSGLLLATTDGELANRLMHPSSEIEREYAVRIYGEVSPEIIETLLAGVELEDGLAKFDSIKDIGGEGQNHWYSVVVAEGRNREVRRLWESQGVQVNRLARNRFGPITLPRRLKRGQSEPLTQKQIEQLYKLTGLPSPFPVSSAQKRKRVRR